VSDAARVTPDSLLRCGLAGRPDLWRPAPAMLLSWTALPSPALSRITVCYGIRFERLRNALQDWDFPRIFPAMKPSLRFLCRPLQSPLDPEKTAVMLAFCAKSLNLLALAKVICQAHNLKVAGSEPNCETNITFISMVY